MSQRVKVRRLTDEEGRQLQRIVRRGGGKSEVNVVRYRRAMVVLASAGGNAVEVIARLVQTSPDRVREMIHRFNDKGMASLDPQWAGGRPRRITTEDEAFIVKTAKERPEKVGRPFTHWSVRKLREYLNDNEVRRVEISKERLRQILDEAGVTFQKTKTWKERTTRGRRRSSTASRRSSMPGPTGSSPSTSSAPSPSTPSAVAAGRRRRNPSGCGPTTTRPAGAAVPRLLLGRRRPAVGRGQAPQGCRQLPGRYPLPVGRPPPTASGST